MAIDTIKSTAVLDGAIATADIADDAVTSDKLATLTGDVSHGDSVKSKFGASDDLQVYHDGSNSYVRDSGTGNLRLTTESSVVLAKHNNENMLKADVDGAVTLYHDAGAKLATTATGVSVTGDLTIAGSGTGVYLGGTGSANKLDDYEEGTIDTTNLNFTISGSATTTANYRTLRYTKVGSIVNITGNVFLDSVTSQSGHLKIPLPFVNASTEKNRTCGPVANAQNNLPTLVIVDQGQTFGRLISSQSFTIVSVAAGHTYVINLSYHTDA